MAYGNNIYSVFRLFAYSSIFLLFSGADVIGYLITGNDFSVPYHFENWWRGFGEIPSTITSIFWTPQHCLPGLLAAFVILRYPVRSIKNLGIIFVAVSGWSPFAAVGLVPIFTWTLYKKKSIRLLITRSNILAAPLLLLILVDYLGEESAKIPRGFIWNISGFSIYSYFCFIVIEYVAISISLIFAARQMTSLILFISIFLTILSIFHFGVLNDLLMRASIPSLGVLASLAGSVIINRSEVKKKIPIAICFLLGLTTPAAEIFRGLSKNRILYPKDIVIQDTIGKDTELARQYFLLNKAMPIITQQVMGMSSISFHPYGVSKVDQSALRVESSDFVDAGLVTSEIKLPSGEYLAEVTLSWEVMAISPNNHAAHFSIHGKKTLYEIMSSSDDHVNLKLYFKTNGDPFRFSFGLGGWSKGRGFIELNRFLISQIK